MMRWTLVLMVSVLGASLGCANESSRPHRRPAAPVPPDAATPRTNTPPIDVLAGVGIGPIRLGATRASLALLGLAPRPSNDPQIVNYGPYTVHIGEGDAVDWVEIALSSRVVPGGLAAYGRALPADPTTLKPVLALIGSCDPAQNTDGGERALCDHGGLTVIRRSAGDAISVHVSRPEIPRTLAPAR